MVVREVTLAAPAAEVGEGGHSPPLFGRRGRRIPLPSALTESPGIVRRAGHDGGESLCKLAGGGSWVWTGAPPLRRG